MKKMDSLFVILAVFLVLISFGGCAKKVATTTQAVEVKEKPIAPPPQEETTKEQPPAVIEQPIVRESAPSGTLADIYFDFDRSDIRPDAKQALEENSRWFKVNSRGRVKIEGHCDERGTTEYNLALGQRRAESAKRFLVASGVDASRISTISYGEERPVCTDHQEGCWSKNRRDHFGLESK